MENDTKTKELGEIISPEGVEERIIREVIFRTTMTGSGKFRTYVIQDSKTIPREIFETKEEAFKEMGGDMILLGGLLNDSKRTLEILMEGFKKEKKR